MSRRFKTTWVIAAFILIGLVVAIILIVRDLQGGSDVPEETGTVQEL